VSVNNFINCINKNGLNHTNSLVDTDDGIKHVLEVPELKEGVAFDAKNPKEEREWMINNIQDSRYCVWKEMTYMDTEYLEGWSEIDVKECECHGIFRNKFVY
jgi:hypothetical protein